MKSNSRVYVIGHKNPDTDSICSAIAYADIKNRTDKTKTYVARRAGRPRARAAGRRRAAAAAAAAAGRWHPA